MDTNFTYVQDCYLLLYLFIPLSPPIVPSSINPSLCGVQVALGSAASVNKDSLSLVGALCGRERSIKLIGKYESQLYTIPSKYFLQKSYDYISEYHCDVRVKMKASPLCDAHPELFLLRGFMKFLDCVQSSHP